MLCYLYFNGIIIVASFQLFLIDHNFNGNDLMLIQTFYILKQKKQTTLNKYLYHNIRHVQFLSVFNPFLLFQLSFFFFCKAFVKPCVYGSFIKFNTIQDVKFSCIIFFFSSFVANNFVGTVVKLMGYLQDDIHIFALLHYQPMAHYAFLIHLTVVNCLRCRNTEHRIFTSHQ